MCPGFSDAVGWMMPLGADADARPHWGVTFAVDDAYATAERAEKLGAEVLVPPFEAGAAHIATLADPQGAAFTVSRYAPPA